MKETLQKIVGQNSTKVNTWVAIFLGVTIFLMIAIFQPFGTYNYQDAKKMLTLSGYGVVIGVSYFLLAEGLPLVFKKFYKKETWTFGKELINVLIVFLLVIAATYVYRNIALGFGYGVYDFFVYTGMAFSIGVFPIAIIFVIRFMQVKSKPVIIYQSVAEVHQTIYITVEGENKNEKLKFAKEELLFIKASDNYVIIHLNKDGKVSKHMLRSSLSNLAGQIEDTDILQVHRSYLVNLENVNELSGKSPNYTLQLKSFEEMIPISRTKVKGLREKLQERPL